MTASATYRLRPTCPQLSRRPACLSRSCFAANPAKRMSSSKSLRPMNLSRSGAFRRRHLDPCRDSASLRALQIRDIDPGPLAVALVTQLGELHVLRAFQRCRAQRLAIRYVTQELLPAVAITVLERLVVGHFLPLRVEVHRLRDFDIPHRLGRRGERLDKAFVTAGQRRAERA